MANSFKELELERADMDQFNLSPGDERAILDKIENNLVRQVDTFSFFGNVVELFSKNALEAVVKIIGGSDDAAADSDVNDFRTKPRPRTDNPDGSRHWATRPVASSPR